MSARERAFTLDIHGEQAVAILAEPAAARSDCGVLVVVGGPQYRVGSHRQFVLLARALAEAGFPVMRFDFRGMGDSSGAMRDFTRVGDDIAVAIDAFLRESTGLRRVVLWGLCDGASASCFHMANDPRVAGAVLLNPWVRSDAGEARVMLKHYYLQRLMSPDFWRKLLSGRFRAGESLGSLGGMLRKASTASASGAGSDVGKVDYSRAPLVEGVPGGLSASGRPALVLLSGNDFVAAEFEAAMDGSQSWRVLTDTGHVRSRKLADANHTFSSAVWREDVFHATRSWLEKNILGEAA
ncbi:hydrolase 1, exosortase A system-associated [Uliginosibacterium sp. H1]|uniref:hydrolase 1, exosortase A system-associated n=1 Tax=Uliginosibacterium sp. H1 TaxID=3114757 RepID=UPI002E1789EC|nr:hydrolase 1, exosortase A system-associated [Uliginosibacterium sp. H1]